MTDKEVIKQALDWITKAYVEICRVDDPRFNNLLNLAPVVIEKLSTSAALAEQDSEPVAWMYQSIAYKSAPVLMEHKRDWAESGSGLWKETPLYAAPQPQPKQDSESVTIQVSKCFWDGDKLMAAPTAPEAPAVQPLTDEQIASIVDNCESNVKSEFLIEFARAIEAAVNAKWEKMLAEQEHIGWLVRDSNGDCELLTDWQISTSLVKYERVHKLYTHPAPAPAQQREWVGLTDADLSVCDSDGVLLARYWERVLKEKNGA